ncbi:MAG: OmpA family protein [Solirubrobacteraceae bacterium]|nr:OmpA family protein [Solirubrobacteraceae bacterium]
MPTSPSWCKGASPSALHRLLTFTLVLLGLALSAAAPASASHLQGGFFTASVTDTGRLQGTVTYLEINACPSGVGSQTNIPITLRSPGGQTVSKNVPATATRCVGGATYTGSFDYPLDTTTFSAGAPDGNYTLTWSSCCRISGIVNLANSGSASVTFAARVRKETGVATGAPNLGSDVATGIGIGQLYSQNLNASDPDDVLGIGTLTYQALTGSGEVAPDSNVISIPKLTANGQIEIPVGTTSGFSNGQRFVYKVRVTDDQGDFAERDVLLKAVTPNRPPVIGGLDVVNGYDINAGGTQTINFTATDPDGANTVTISGAGLPAWASLSQTSGNPAQGTLTLNPPNGANTRDFRLNFDAVDNDSSQVLTGSATVEVRVAGTPETQLLTKPAALSNSGTADFTFRAADPGYTFECSIDGGTVWDPCTTPKQYTGLSDGPKTFKVRANDGTQVDPTPASYTWTIDTTPPTTTIATKPAAATTSTTANFTFTSNETGNVTYECRLDGGSWAACTTPESYTGLADGSHTLEVRGTDTLGHVETTPVSYTWVIDRTAPSTSIVSGPPALTDSASAPFDFSSDESGVTYECKLDAGSWAACTDPDTFTGIADGDHTLLVRATDAAGNTDGTPASHLWTVDTSAPDTTLTQQPPSLTNLTTADFAFTSADPGATFECKLDAGAWAPCTSPDQLTSLADGDHTLLVRSVDTAGNRDPSPASHTWTVDTQAPTSAIADKPTELTNAVDANFTFTSTDPGATFECKLDAGTWVACPSPKALAGLTDGSHTFSVRAIDAAGNVEASPTTYTWVVDTQAPAAPTFKQAPSAQASSTTFVIEREADTTLECQVDGGAWVPCGTTFSPELADGEHTVKVRQTDAAGNVSPVAQHTWTLDRAAPEAPVTVSGPTGSTTELGATFDFTAEPGASLECRVDGGAWAPCVSPFVLSDLGLGDHVLELRATDAAGNTSPVRTERWTITKKQAPAEAPKPAPAGPAAPETPVALRVEVSRSVSVDPKKSTVGCRLEGVTIESCEVGIFAMKSDLGLAKKGSPEDKLVRIGTGTATADGDGERVGVKIVLNGTGRRAMDRVGGVKVRVNIKANPTDGKDSLYAHRYTKIRPATQMVVPSDGLFATNSAVISIVGKRYLQSVGGGLYGAKRLKCIGHTDAQGAASYNARLGLARAKAVCAYLTRLGVKVSKQVSSAGEAKPRATNTTAKGRALNRRVELSLNYQ